MCLVDKLVIALSVLPIAPSGGWLCVAALTERSTDCFRMTDGEIS